MGKWIERSKETLKGIIENVRKDYEGLKVRVAFVGYRDINDKSRFEIMDFSEDLDAVTAFIAKQKACSNDCMVDWPEDV
jgi:molybdenum cofactor biosynthesis enzyme MoaA